MNVPILSILMPVYNVENYIEEAVYSILNQTFRDFELIILDDCSPDKSLQIVKNITDPRIMIYHGEKNVGLANILNVGLKLARGKYIGRMDSDDISDLSRFEKQITYMESHPDVDLCSCAMELFGAKNDIWIRNSNFEEIKISALFFSPILHASSVWRRKSFEGLEFRQEMVPAEDYDLWTRAIAKGLKLINIPEVLYKYRIHPTQITTNVSSVQKLSDVKTNYLHMIFPNGDVDDIIIVDVICENDLYILKKSINKLLDINKINSFFNPTLLRKRLWNYYCVQVIKLFNRRINIKLLKGLPIKWKIRYIYKYFKNLF